MSPLDHDHPLQKGPAPRQRTGRPLAPAGGTRTRRRSDARAGETAAAGTPTPRPGDSPTTDATRVVRRSAARGTAVRTRAATAAGAARTAAGATRSAGSKAAAAAKAAKSSPATAAAARAAKTVATRAASTAAATAGAAKSAAAAKAAARSTTVKPSTDKPTAAKSTTAEPAAAKATPAERAAAKPAGTSATSLPIAVQEQVATAPARRPRPTPRPRPAAVETAPEALAEAQLVRDLDDAATLAAAGEAQSRSVIGQLTEAAAPGVVVEELEPADGTTEPRRRQRLARLRRRPTLAVVAVVISALGVGAVAVGTAAQADTAEQPSHSMSVAAELGISSQQPLTAPDAQDAGELADLAASRATRQAEQTAAAQAQQQADALAAAAIAEAQRPKAVLPVNGARLTTCFCMRWGTMHWGIDLAAPMLTPEYAAMDGVVLEAGPASGFGQAVYIQHENGDVTVYGHMEEILVHAGQVVKAGDTIALLGSQGQSTGPHLHFEVHQGGINGTRIDPIPWLADRGVQLG